MKSLELVEGPPVARDYHPTAGRRKFCKRRGLRYPRLRLAFNLLAFRGLGEVD
jgi:hypothetical protein